MSQAVIAKRYAKALSNLAEKEKSLESVGNDLLAIAEVFNSSPDLSRVWVDTKIGMKVKEDILVELLKKLNVQPLVNTFVRYLLSKRRIILLPDIEQSFASLVQEKLGRLDAEVTVAYKLPATSVEQLEQRLSDYSGKKVQVTVNVDSSIIGGIVTRIGSIVIDGSIRNQLAQVHQSIIRG